MPEQMSDADKLRYQAYLDDHKILVERESEQSRSFDKTLISISSGALGLSLTFIRYMAPNPEYLLLLYIALVCFILSIFSMLASFLSAQHSMRRQRDINTNAYQKFEYPPKETNGWTKWTLGFTYASMSTFFFGWVFFALFVEKNL
jgi:hypothetical protein